MSAISGFCEKCNKFMKRQCDGIRNTCMSILFDTIEALQQENQQLRAQVGKPTIEQVAWIAKCISQNADEQGTFRHLIYDIMGYGGEAYQPLCEAGLLRINNSMTELTPEQVEALQQENEQLQAQLDEWKYEAKCHMDEVAARDKEIERLKAQVDTLSATVNMLAPDEIGKECRHIEALRKAREAIKAAWSDGSANAAMDKASEALAAIDKAIGGKEDEV